jgi:hypothetical protein
VPLVDDVAAFAQDFGAPPAALAVRHLAVTVTQGLALPPERRERASGAPKDWPLSDGKGPFKVELEALDPDVLDGILEGALAMVLDPRALEAAMAAVRQVKARTLRELVERLDVAEDR